MAFAIHNEAIKKQMNIDISRPQEEVTFEKPPDTWLGTMSRGLPVKRIPDYNFPRCIYLWPNKPTRTIVHRNDKHEVVHEEIEPTEHMSKNVSCETHVSGGLNCPDCEALLQEALAEGWVLQPYMPKPLVKPEASLYGRATSKGEK
jgi:hypothetical protein